MATIRNRLGKINMFTQGRDFDIPKYLAEKGLDVNVEYVPNGMDNGMLAIEVFEKKNGKKMVELIIEIIIGMILGATAMSLCAAAKERDKR